MSDDVVEFVCEGCAARVLGIGYRRVPVSHLCSTCAWFCEHLDPAEFWDAYSRHRGLTTHAR